MAHTLAFRKLIRLLQQARRNNLQVEGLPPPITQQQSQQSRRGFLKTAGMAGVSGLLATTVPGISRLAFASGSEKTNRIAIIGAGLAGLNAAYQLKKVGIQADVYEASQRLGGRVFSKTGGVRDGLTIEYGAEFINTDHADMLALAHDFALPLFDRYSDAANAAAPQSAYYFADKSWSDAELVELLQPLVTQISIDADLIDRNWDDYAPEFDRMSVSDYLDKYNSLIPQPFIHTLIECAIRVEYGVEAAQSTALQLLFLLPNVDGTSVELIGYSDEAFSVEGGNSRIIEGLSNALIGQIHTGMKLTKLEKESKHGYELHFENGKEIEADFIILAIPFSVLRHIKIKAPLPRKLKQFIRKVDLGNNEKLLAGFSQRVWRQVPGFTLEAWTDLGFSEVWDATQRQTDHLDGVLTYYLGGKEVEALDNWPGGVNAAGSEFTKRLSRYVSALTSTGHGNHTRTSWTRNPHSQGAYVNFQPGQLTHFGEYLWVESDDPAERQAVHVGRLLIAGEQVSDEFYGFMNGAAQTGRLAAQLVLQMMIIKQGNQAQYK